MNLIPQRTSLSHEVVKVLRDGLLSGVWSEWLPGERSLCERLHVSRPTVRAALSELRREGLIDVVHGRRSRILTPERTLLKRAPSKVVCMLSPVPLPSLRPFIMFLVDETREFLAEAGYRLEVETSPRYYTRRPYKALESLIKEKSVVCWNLFRATPQMQMWFAEHRLPVVINGSSHRGVQLPSVDLDYRATCRHAGGTLLARGHRHIALLIESTQCAGDEDSRLGFLEAAKAIPGVQPRLTIAEHNGTVAGIRAKIENLMRANSRPTALLVANSMHVLTVMGQLLRTGFHVPGDVALLSRDDDSFLQYIVPTVARYNCSPAHFASKSSHLILQVARGETVSRKAMLLVPQLIKGETLGPHEKAEFKATLPPPALRNLHSVPGQALLPAEQHRRHSNLSL
jgi:DNA-binding LacI/PurR family transcriptional regulator